jgi:Arc/MetJ-type ribon-helix-helix transcriptional regulator
MSAGSASVGKRGEQLQEVLASARELLAHPPAELASLLELPELGGEDRRAIETVIALQILQAPHLSTELLPLLRPGGDADVVFPPHIPGDILLEAMKHAGAVRKVSVSMPQELTSAVQRRVGRGKFSQYVTEAVARQLELDLLGELSELLASEQGPVPEAYLAEARAAWPDDPSA